jgi:hypothetical protein
VIKAGTPAPPLATVFNAPPAVPEPEAVAVTALAGMLSPVPSVKADVPLGTHAQTVTCVRPGFRTHEVWIVLVVVPALDAVLGARVKLTAAPEVTLTESDSGRVAFRVMVPTFELTWANAARGIDAAKVTTIIAFQKFLMEPPFEIGSGKFSFSTMAPVIPKLVLGLMHDHFRLPN